MVMRGLKLACLCQHLLLIPQHAKALHMNLVWMC